MPALQDSVCYPLLLGRRHHGSVEYDGTILCFVYMNCHLFRITINLGCVCSRLCPYSKHPHIMRLIVTANGWTIQLFGTKMYKLFSRGLTKCSGIFVASYIFIIVMNIIYWHFRPLLCLQLGISNHVTVLSVYGLCLHCTILELVYKFALVVTFRMDVIYSARFGRCNWTIWIGTGMNGKLFGERCFKVRTENRE